MNNVNKTLYIPLRGKADVSKKGIILHDPRAEEIWEKEGFELRGKAKSKWLAYFMGMRSAVFDKWLEENLEKSPEAAVLHIGCGMDSRAERVGAKAVAWYDVDFPEVISERKKYYSETGSYRMISSDARETQWLAAVSKENARWWYEGLMYLKREELLALLAALSEHLKNVKFHRLLHGFCRQSLKI